jgi:O-antigen ligase
LSHGRARESRTGRAQTGEARAIVAIVALLLLITPLIVVRDAKEAFRLGQGLVAGWLGLASLVVAAWALRRQPHVSWRVLVDRPVLRAMLPLTLVVIAGAATTSHPTHYRAAMADFLIGAACLAGWSLALEAPALRRLLLWIIPPATLVAALALDQSSGWFGTLDWLQVSAPTARLRITSTVGNPGDVAALLVLPLLVGLDATRTIAARWRPLLAVAMVIMISALVLTATLAAFAALAVGAAVWWLRRPRPARSLVAAAAAIAIAGAAIAAAPPLRTRVIEKTSQLARGDVNAALTGRLDGWRAAGAMLARHPIAGVGFGAFRAAFADTRLDLSRRGVTFYAEQHQVMLATPHNEVLSVAAELGVVGLIALAWAVWTLGVALARLTDPDDAPLAWAGAATLAVLAMVWFPLHVASAAWPWLLGLAWIFRASEEAG